MPIKLSGPLSASEIATEFVNSTPYSMSELYRGGLLVPVNVANAGVPTAGAIRFGQFYGTSNIVDFALNITGNIANANLRTLAVNAGWDQQRKVKMTINPGVYVSSTTTGGYALIVSGSFPNGVEIINNGLIIGMGGNGGAGSTVIIADAATGAVATSPGSAGGGGGPALYVDTPTTITNNGTIGGGGGGGGGGRTQYRVTADGKGFFYFETQRAGGGGGGRTNPSANSGGGAAGQALPNGQWTLLYSGAFFVYAGNGGTVNGAGGGGRGDGINAGWDGGVGGSGGNWGSPGGSGSPGVGFTGASGAGGPYGGGGGGAAVVGNGNITWLAFGTRLGSIF